MSIQRRGNVLRYPHWQFGLSFHSLLVKIILTTHLNVLPRQFPSKNNMHFSFAQLAVLAMALGVASAAPKMDPSTGLEARYISRLHFRQVMHAHKTSGEKDADDDDNDSSSSSRIVIIDSYNDIILIRA